MVKRNEDITKLKSGYLFPEIIKRKNEFLKKNPSAKLLSLGIGDTTQPISEHVTEALQKIAAGLGTESGYKGYGDEQGLVDLRNKISKVVYNGNVNEDEVFISDGAKPDVGRMQLLFGKNSRIAVQDPAYPVYIDTSVMSGKTGGFNSVESRFDNITYMECTPENDFFPDLKKMEPADLIFFCSPNNPTGAVSTKKQLSELIKYAHNNKAIIIFDAAYSEFIQNSELPKSIYEIEGSKEVAIEINSFSKPFGFTGVRLGWNVIPDELKYDDGTLVKKDWSRIMATLFNGASIISQYGGLAALEPQGILEMKNIVQYYMQNAKIIEEALKESGCKVFGGENAPYLWATLKDMDSWSAFDFLLEKANIITTPGSGFGKNGEGFLRYSAFGYREDIIKAAERLKNCLK
jgi:LL-diaminopimelate aminotransferase